MSGEVQGMRGLNRRLDAISNPAQRRYILGRIGLEAVRYSKLEAPRRTSNLSRTIRLGTVTDTSVEIVAGGMGGVGYARAVHEGARPHKIRPRHKRVLRWPRNAGDRTLGGRARAGTTDFIFAGEVNHPGNKPNRFIIRGIVRALGQGALRKQVIKAWNGAA
jgi:hypothetical protein